MPHVSTRNRHQQSGINKKEYSQMCSIFTKVNFVYTKKNSLWGRPKLTWAEGIRGLMGEKGLMEEDWNDRGNWRKKIL